VIQTPTDEQFLAEAAELVQQMKNADIPLRIMAGCGVRIHCPDHVQLHKVKMRRNIRDIDFATLSKHKKNLESLLDRLGYSPQIAKLGMDRDIYGNRAKGITLDIFFDRLNMCHVIELADRLENDFPTVSLADLVLQKLQIVEVNERDLKDLVVLFLEHNVGETDRETIDGRYIAELLSNDWGFYFTASENIKKSNSIVLKQYGDMMSQEERQIFQARIGQLLSMVEAQPKSLKWRMRQKVGTKRIWYNEVEEKERGTLAEYLMKKNEERGKLGS
jgi:hypothetical protein